MQADITPETALALDLESCYKAFGKSIEINSNCILIAPVFGFEEVNSATCAKKFNSNWIMAQSDQTQSILSNLIIVTELSFVVQRTRIQLTIKLYNIAIINSRNRSPVRSYILM